MRNERSRERSDEELQQQRQQQEQIQQRQHDDEIVSGHSASGLDELQVMERVSGDDRGAVEAQVPPPAQIQRRPAGEEQQVERRRTAEELGNTAIQIAFETIQEDEEEQKNKGRFEGYSEELLRSIFYGNKQFSVLLLVNSSARGNRSETQIESYLQLHSPRISTPVTRRN